MPASALTRVIYTSMEREPHDVSIHLPVVNSRTTLSKAPSGCVSKKPAVTTFHNLDCPTVASGRSAKLLTITLPIVGVCARTAATTRTPARMRVNRCVPGVEGDDCSDDGGSAAVDESCVYNFAIQTNRKCGYFKLVRIRQKLMIGNLPFPFSQCLQMTNLRDGLHGGVDKTGSKVADQRRYNSGHKKTRDMVMNESSGREKVSCMEDAEMKALGSQAGRQRWMQ